MFDEERGLYTIGTVAEMMNEHPETLRVWEKNGLVTPHRINNQRRYSNIDLRKLKFIKYLLDEKGLNIAGVRQIIEMYPCWLNKVCSGGAAKNNSQANSSKPCWKHEGTYCILVTDKTDLCSTCSVCKNCIKGDCTTALK